MAEKQTKTVTINGTDYTEDQLTDQQKVMINHVADLDRKLQTARFNTTQLEGGRKFFMDMLTKSLEESEEAQEVAAQ